jgi:thiol-disulfide isomerase/thioredoxin
LRRILIATLLSLCFFDAYCQNDTIAPYLRTREIPSFRVSNVVDSSTFSKEDLQKDKRTIFIIFSPDCGHCQHFMKELTDSISEFRNTQILMVATVDFVHIRKFYDDFKAATIPFITIGRDPAYFLGSYFAARQYPAIYIYDNKGKFVRNYQGGAAIKDIAATE